MRFLYLFVCCVFSMACLNLHAQENLPYALVRIHLGDKTMSDLAALGIETDHGKYTPGRSLETVLNKEEQTLVQQAGFATEILVPDMKAWYLNGVRESIVEDRNGDCELSGNEPQVFPTPVNYTYGSMGGYHTYAEMLAVLDDMAAKFPNLITVRSTISDTLLTHEGRPLYWVRISDNPTQDENEPELLYTALHHAREPNSASQMLYYMWHLLEQYDADPTVQYLVNQSEMYFIPCINPDGYLFNEVNDPEGGGMWRKNRRANPNGSFGVDLNRNYGFQWGIDDIGSSGNQNSTTYRGPEAFSEPETRLVRDFCLAHNFRFVLNYHTYGNILIYPWAYNNETADPAFVDYAKLLTRDNGYISGTTQNVLNYSVNGSSDDWMHAETGAYSMTPEVGSNLWGFWPLPDEIEGLNQANVWPNLAVALSTLRYGRVENDGDELMHGKTDTFNLVFRRYGLEDGPITVTIIPPPNVFIASGVQVFDLNHLETGAFNPIVNLDEQVLPGTELVFLIEVNNGFFTAVDTLRKKYVGNRVVALSDNGSLNGQWIGDWSTTDEQFVSPPASFTDSPEMPYAANAYAYWETAAPVFIPSDVQFPRLQFWARWNIENNYDYAQVLASGNGGNYTNLCGQFTTDGSPAQGDGLPIYDDNQSFWVYECMDLSAFIGQTVSLRFELISDGATELDGIYIDDVQVVYFDSSGISALQPEPKVSRNVELMPNPAASQATIFWPASNEETNIRVFDALGRQIFHTKVDGGQKRFVLPCAHFPEGVYQVLVQSNNEAGACGRLVVRH